MNFIEPPSNQNEWRNIYENLSWHHTAFKNIYPLNFPDSYHRIKGVYGICDEEKNFYYIGASKNVRQRIVNHWRQLERDFHSNNILQTAYYFNPVLYAIYLNSDPRAEEYFNQKYIGGRNGVEKFYHEQYN